MSAKGLGKGFEALVPLGMDIKDVVSANDKVHKLAVDIVKPRDDQPRKKFDEDALVELAQSIRTHGILQPIIVAQIEQNKYSIIAGERRYRAALIAGLKEIPVIIRSATEHEQLEIALLENVQRADLTPIEQAITIHKLHTQFSQSYEEISKRLGKAQTTIINNIRLLSLPVAMQESLQVGTITEGHARSLLSLQKYPDEQQTLFANIVSKGWTVRQAEQYVVSVKKAKVAKSSNDKIPNPDIDKLTKKIKSYLSANKVMIQRSAKGSGKLVISYKTEEEFSKIINRILKS